MLFFRYLVSNTEDLKEELQALDGAHNALLGAVHEADQSLIS
jgi:hypothetical protein